MQPKILDFGSLQLEFKNNIVIFEASTLKFGSLENSAENQNCVDLGRKMPYLIDFGDEFLKSLSY